MSLPSLVHIGVRTETTSVTLEQVAKDLSNRKVCFYAFGKYGAAKRSRKIVDDFDNRFRKEGGEHTYTKNDMVVKTSQGSFNEGRVVKFPTFNERVAYPGGWCTRVSSPVCTRSVYWNGSA